MNLNGTQNTASSNNVIDRSKKNVIMYPIYSFLGCFILVNTLKYGSIPMYFKNPIAPIERSLQRNKFFKYFMSNHLLFIFSLGGLCLGFAKYEFTKYYYYLKYRRLVTSYLESCE